MVTVDPPFSGGHGFIEPCLWIWLIGNRLWADLLYPDHRWLFPKLVYLEI